MHPPAVKIIGISSGVEATAPEVGGSPADVDRPAPQQHKFCQLWFRNASFPQTTAAEYLIVPETHDRKYAASFHICSVPQSDTPPYAVSLVTDRCQSPRNVLLILDTALHTAPTVDFAVCIAPLNFRFDDDRRLVEFVEANRMFGAERLVFYNHSTGGRVDSALRRYAADGVATVVPWRVPVAVDVWPPDAQTEPEIHYFAQLAALNDCLYRSLAAGTRFVVASDLDELVVPRRRRRWRPLLEDATRLWRRQFVSVGGRFGVDRAFPGAYLVRNVFFRTNWADDDRPAELLTLRKTRREDRPFPYYARCKYITWTRAATMLGVHTVIELVHSSLRSSRPVLVDETDALLHHYRQWDGDSLGFGSNRPTTDRRMRDFRDELVARVAARAASTRSR